MAENPTPRSDCTFDFTGSRVLVTGASRGIGATLALAFAGAGADLIITARSLAALDATALAARALGRDVICRAVDQTSVDAVAQGLADLPTIDVLINNAGVEDVRPALDIDEPLWDKIVDTNLKGAFFVAQAAARSMQAAGGGAIVNMASLTSFVGVPTAVPYSASKSGVLGMTRALAAEWAPQGIRVNAIAPGYFETELTQEFYKSDDWVGKMTASVPMGRLGDLDDICGAAMFLASDGARYIAGQCLAIDGGFLAQI